MLIPPTFFKTQSDFRKWLTKNHNKATELFVGFYKVVSGKPSLTWPESVDQALCFGWIDGVRRRIDDDSYSIRFTPRKPTSIWSAINIKKVEELIKLGQMRPAGLAAFEKRKKVSRESMLMKTSPQSSQLSSKNSSKPTKWPGHSLLLRSSPTKM